MSDTQVHSPGVWEQGWVSRWDSGRLQGCWFQQGKLRDSRPRLSSSTLGTAAWGSCCSGANSMLLTSGEQSVPEPSIREREREIVSEAQRHTTEPGFPYRPAVGPVEVITALCVHHWPVKHVTGPLKPHTLLLVLKPCSLHHTHTRSARTASPPPVPVCVCESRVLAVSLACLPFMAWLSRETDGRGQGSSDHYDSAHLISHTLVSLCWNWAVPDTP